eukprot:FR736562.1.p1 GENE.FR736562.1~~FR736562.1.p1  ORF type:complete len:184 (+),score=21.44 FR736562.1:91-642(+)
MFGLAVVDVLELIYYAIINNFEDEYIGILSSLAICFCFVAGNNAFLGMMNKRSLVGTRCIIICNITFSVAMLSDLILIVCQYDPSNDDFADDYDQLNTTINQVVLILKLLEAIVCVAFFVVAGLIYARLWSLYRYDGRSLGQRMCEIIPAVLSAGGIASLMLIGLTFNNGQYKSLFWNTFVRR